MHTGKCILSLSVRPRSGRSEAILTGDILKIFLKAAPADNEANTELIAYLSKKLGVSKSNISIIRGGTSRHKDVEIIGLSKEEAIALLLA